jgi:hypothetical protein
MKSGGFNTVTPREQELLNDLEAIRRTGKRITIVGFAKKVGYANKSALRHFPKLKKELADYVEQFTPNVNTRGQTSSVKALEMQVERLERKLRRSEKQLERIPILEGEVAALEKEKSLSQIELATLRGMISILIAFIAENKIESAVFIEARLTALATALIDGEDLDASVENPIPDTGEEIDSDNVEEMKPCVASRKA